MAIEIIPDARGYRISTPFNRGFVDGLKAAVPPDARHFEGGVWIIEPAHVRTAQALLQKWFNRKVDVPALQIASKTVQTTLRIEYLGRTAPREDGSVYAMGFCNGAWSVRFPEPLLRAWFEGPCPSATPAPARTLYSALGITPDADGVALKSAYRRMARQWHPDVCREPEAPTRFHELQQAYAVLSDAGQRQRYDVGLKLEAQAARPVSRSRADGDWGYRTPLRCGQVTVTAQASIKGYVVEQLHQWADIVRADGRVMVSSWKPGTDGFSIAWVEQ